MLRRHPKGLPDFRGSARAVLRGSGRVLGLEVWLFGLRGSELKRLPWGFLNFSSLGDLFPPRPVCEPVDDTPDKSDTLDPATLHP